MAVTIDEAQQARAALRVQYDDTANGGGTGPSSGDGLLLEDGTSFLLLEDGSFLLLE